MSIRIKRNESHLLPANKKTAAHGHYRDDRYSERRRQFRGVWLLTRGLSSLFSLFLYLLSQRRSSGGIIPWKITGNKTERARRPWDSAGKHLCGYIPEQPDLIDSLTPVFKKRSSLDPRINKPRKRRQQHAIVRTRENLLILFIERERFPRLRESHPMRRDVTALAPHHRRDRSINTGNVRLPLTWCRK